MKLNPWSAAASIGAICAATLLLLPAPASACGGFFCNQVPIDQSGEHILFSVEDDGTIEAHVQIQYQGPSEDFAWIVPTPSRPEVGVGTATLFTRLTQLLQPQFILEWQEIGECWDDFLDDDLSPTAGGGDGEPDRGGVDVVETGEVGPYDFAVLQATDTEELFVWLQENEFFIPDDVQPFVDPYVMMGNEIHFVAFKLSKDSDAGDIQPVTLRYEGTEPMIPIQLTAIATTPDMGVTAHVLGDPRAQCRTTTCTCTSTRRASIGSTAPGTTTTSSPRR